MSIPKPEPKALKDINWVTVAVNCEYHLSYIQDNDDSANYIYESVMEAIYGEDVWDYINSKMEEIS